MTKGYAAARAELAAADDAFNKAWAIFDPVRRAHANIKIPMDCRPTADEFYAAQAEFKKAEAAYDAAWIKLQKAKR